MCKWLPVYVCACDIRFLHNRWDRLCVICDWVKYHVFSLKSVINPHPQPSQLHTPRNTVRYRRSHWCSHSGLKLMSSLPSPFYRQNIKCNPMHSRIHLKTATLHYNILLFLKNKRLLYNNTCHIPLIQDQIINMSNFSTKSECQCKSLSCHHVTEAEAEETNWSLVLQFIALSCKQHKLPTC